MPHTTKIATCCYCGTRAALSLRGKIRHELSCSACGAPLHDLKALPLSATVHHRDNPRLPAMALPAKTRPSAPSRKRRPLKRDTPRKRRKSFVRWAIEEVFDDAFDVLEDIFD